MENENVYTREVGVEAGSSTQNVENGKLGKKDLFDLKAYESSTHARSNKRSDWGTTLKLAFQCIGVVYGDLGTSPLYALPGIFPDGIKNNDDLLGVLSLIIYSILIITLIKYVFLVLAANDNGEGGTFALYSLICRHANVNMIPNLQPQDRQVSKYELETGNQRTKMASAIKSRLENTDLIKLCLLLMSILGVAMVLGDGILTPVISVLSAVGGIKKAHLSETAIMWISVGVLILLFQIQRFGTEKIGYTFAPIIMLWFGFIGMVGIYNTVKYEPSVLRAVNPWYIIKYFQRNKKDAWISLGGVMLCLTGSEALFADLGHFNIVSIRISSCSVLIPSVLLAYTGQCSYLWGHTEDVGDAFYNSIPKSLYWPQFIVAILAAIIASQSLISASFSIIQQSVAFGCFPRVKVVHTSPKHEGQVYVPEINTLLMLACVGVTLGFKNTLTISNAYGIAVSFVFVITSSFLVLIMLMIWKTNIILVIIYVLTISLIELIFLSSNLYKFVDGGYLPLIFALVVVVIMFIWNYGYKLKYTYELENKVAVERLDHIMSDQRIHRARGVGLFYTPLLQGISPIFIHYLSSVSSLHSVAVFVSIKSFPISRVPTDERFLFQRLKPGEMIFRCVVRYGYRDSGKDQELFKQMMLSGLKEFIRGENGDEMQRELAVIDEGVNDGVVYVIGEGVVMTSNESSVLKKLTINYFYNWLSRCVRQSDEIFLVPHQHLLKIGMIYDV